MRDLLVRVAAVEVGHVAAGARLERARPVPAPVPPEQREVQQRGAEREDEGGDERVRPQEAVLGRVVAAARAEVGDEVAAAEAGA